MFPRAADVEGTVDTVHTAETAVYPAVYPHFPIRLRLS